MSGAAVIYCASRNLVSPRDTRLFSLMMDKLSGASTVDLHGCGYTAQDLTVGVHKAGKGEQQHAGFRFGMSLTGCPEDLDVKTKRAIMEAFSHEVVARVNTYYPRLLTCEDLNKAPKFPSVDWKDLKDAGGSVAPGAEDLSSKVQAGSRKWSDDDVYSLVLEEQSSNPSRSTRVKCVFDWNLEEAVAREASRKRHEVSQLVRGTFTYAGAVATTAFAASTSAGTHVAAPASVAAVLLWRTWYNQTADIVFPRTRIFYPSCGPSSLWGEPSDRVKAQIDSLVPQSGCVRALKEETTG